MTTLRQKNFIENLGENGGNLRKAAIDAGYSQKMANNPKRILQGKGMRQLTADIHDPQYLSKLHNKLLDSVVISQYTFPNALSDSSIMKVMKETNFKLLEIVKTSRGKICHYLQPDTKTQIKALEMAYKLSELYSQPGVTLEDSLSKFSNDELYDLAHEAFEKMSLLRQEKIRRSK